ncbi:MFS transporter [Virgibacillus siamensis]|uniref:MFS transporter n=1 Tax=Virgibacillus siamensis TaxID=480071 RepID=UPI0009862AAE|nr:MFS transporter [Virgibacillus siamensis]
MAIKTMEDGHEYNTAKLWQIGLFTLNNTSTNLYLFALTFVTYYATGFVGLAVLVVSTLLGAMRLFDGIIDPAVGFIIDKTETKFGKYRPLIIIGNIILAISILLIYATHLLPEAIRLVALVLFYIIHKIGYSIQTSVTKAGQTVLTNHPKQRPLYAIFDGIYNALLFTGGQVFVASYLVAKHGGFNLDLFAELNTYTLILSGVFAVLAVIALGHKDSKQYYGLGEDTTETNSIREYWQVIKKNKPLLLLSISASSDKLASQLIRQSVVVVMLFGILLGNYELSGTMSMVIILPQILISFFVVAIARKTGLKKAYLSCVWVGFISLVGLFSLFLIIDNPSSISMSNIGIATIVFLTLYTLAMSFGFLPTTLVVPMVADVSDYETHKSGRYIPGMMGTIFSFIDQFVSSAAPLIMGIVVAIIGYGSEYPEIGEQLTTPLFWATLILAFGIPALLLIVSIVCMKFYKLNKKTMAEIQEGIAEVKEKAKQNHVSDAFFTENK